jgi:hypothetical protein
LFLENTLIAQRGFALGIKTLLYIKYIFPYIRNSQRGNYSSLQKILHLSSFEEKTVFSAVPYAEVANPGVWLSMERIALVACMGWWVVVAPGATRFLHNPGYHHQGFLHSPLPRLPRDFLTLLHLLTMTRALTLTITKLQRGISNSLAIRKTP